MIPAVDFAIALSSTVTGGGILYLCREAKRARKQVELNRRQAEQNRQRSNSNEKRSIQNRLALLEAGLVDSFRRRMGGQTDG